VNRELWIVTAKHGDRCSGLAATWVSAASIDRQRAVLLAGLSPNHFTTELVRSSGCFAAHLLRPDQTELAWRLASSSGRDGDKLAGLAVQPGHGSPVLSDCLAWFDCHVFSRYDAGDRLYFWADVVAAGRDETSAAQPLCEREFFVQLTPAQRDQLAADREADAAKGRPLHAAWRRQTEC
jgi:flavin reductase (DIM6/NTAB) family NADH-FMN oxidoreductase RutF